MTEAPRLSLIQLRCTRHSVDKAPRIDKAPRFLGPQSAPLPRSPSSSRDTALSKEGTPSVWEWGEGPLAFGSPGRHEVIHRFIHSNRVQVWWHNTYMNSDTTLFPGCVLSSLHADKVTFEVIVANEDGTYAGEIRCDGVLVALMDRFEATEDWELIEEPCDCPHCVDGWAKVTAEWVGRGGG